MAKKALDIEYVITLHRRFDEHSAEEVTIVTLETIRLFQSFRYDLVVDDLFEHHHLYLKIMGLRSPDLIMPETGSARWTKSYPDLTGAVDIVVEKRDGTKNQLSALIMNDTVSILKKPSSVSGKSSRTQKPFLHSIAETKD